MSNKLSLRAKLLLSAVMTIFLIVLLGGVGIFKMNQMANVAGQALLETKAEDATKESVEKAHTFFKTQVQEWKNILIRGNDPQNFDKYLGQFGDEEKKVQSALNTASGSMKALGLDSVHPGWNPERCG